jgi:ABC-type transporter Mla MlaB component
VFRLSVHDDGRRITLRLEGKLVGSCVAELRRTWLSLAAQQRPVHVNLDAVGFVDTAGSRLLAAMQHAGASLSSSDVFMRSLLREFAPVPPDPPRPPGGRPRK